MIIIIMVTCRCYNMNNPNSSNKKMIVLVVYYITSEDSAILPMEYNNIEIILPLFLYYLRPKDK